MSAHVQAPRALAGVWREAGGVTGLVKLDVFATTPGMVVVAKVDEPWQTRPELRWQTWPDLLEAERSGDQISSQAVIGRPGENSAK